MDHVKIELAFPRKWNLGDFFVGETLFSMSLPVDQDHWAANMNFAMLFLV